MMKDSRKIFLWYDIYVTCDCRKPEKQNLSYNGNELYCKCCGRLAKISEIKKCGPENGNLKSPDSELPLVKEELEAERLAHSETKRALEFPGEFNDSVGDLIICGGQ